MTALPVLAWLVFTPSVLPMGSASLHVRSVPQIYAPSVPRAVPDLADPSWPIETDTTQLLLTENALKHLTVFQEFLLQEQDKVIDYVQSHQVKLRVPIERPMQLNGENGVSRGVVTFTVFDIDALAKQFPSIVEGFTHTHLTPKQWREYRRSLAIAVLLDHFFPTDQPPSDLAGSIAWKNVQFYRTHLLAIEAMVANGYWLPFHDN